MKNSELAMVYACRQLEICGYCPYEKNHNLNKKFSQCEKADHQVYNCHLCIKEFFEQQAEKGFVNS